jgi:hypothetical protein
MRELVVQSSTRPRYCSATGFNSVEEADEVLATMTPHAAPDTFCVRKQDDADAHADLFLLPQPLLIGKPSRICLSARGWPSSGESGTDDDLCDVRHPTIARATESIEMPSRFQPLGDVCCGKTQLYSP